MDPYTIQTLPEMFSMLLTCLPCQSLSTLPLWVLKAPFPPFSSPFLTCKSCAPIFKFFLSPHLPPPLFSLFTISSFELFLKQNTKNEKHASKLLGCCMQHVLGKYYSWSYSKRLSVEIVRILWFCFSKRKKLGTNPPASARTASKIDLPYKYSLKGHFFQSGQIIPF